MLGFVFLDLFPFVYWNVGSVREIGWFFFVHFEFFDFFVMFGVAVLEEDNLGKKQIRVSNDEFMDEKENVSAGNALVVPRETPIMPMSKRKAKGFNLRKSLAWNKAFFTEEGAKDFLNFGWRSFCFLVVFSVFGLIRCS